MCRSQEDGGRRCPHSHRTGAALAAHNTNRRVARDTRRQLGGLLDATNPDLAEAVKHLPPDEAVTYAADHGVQVAAPTDEDTTSGETVAQRATRLPPAGEVRQAWKDTRTPLTRTRPVAYREKDRLTKQVKEWAENLPPIQQESLSDYTEDAYESINKSLNRGDPLNMFNENTHSRLCDADVAENLDRALACAPESDTDEVVYRGISVDHVPPSGVHAWAKRTWPVGSQFDLPGYTSTSHDPAVAAGMVPMGAGGRVKHTHPNVDVAAERKKSRGVVFEIVTRRGAYVAPLSRWGEEEQERLLSRGSRFEVVDVCEEKYEVFTRSAANSEDGEGTFTLTTVKVVDVTAPEAAADTGDSAAA